MEYPFEVIEKKWQKIWAERKCFTAKEDSSQENYYVLSMFPYPSGALHMGHVSNYSIGDAIARYKKMQGYNVLQPMGYDAFGMPAENFAIQHNSHPKITTEQNIAIMRKQLQDFGFGLDWAREVTTCVPQYYRWGQWLFKRMYEKGLAYKRTSFVNWCDECQTVLANEQVEDGHCWRCSSVVRQKELEQWFFRITDYAEELLDFSGMIDWPERVITMQKNWIGKSFGTEIDFRLEDSSEMIKVFTTRPDTLFGVTFMAVPPEHPLVRRWLDENPDNQAMHDFCERVINEDKFARGADDTQKEGIFTGHYCINPVNSDRVQIWVTNYVLMDYGTGAVMAVPAHDQRDYDFAKKYTIPMKIVIQNKEKSLQLSEMTAAYIEPGTLVQSGPFDGMDSVASKAEISKWLEEQGMGQSTVTYRLRDWGISRQRYWGNPIPIVYCDDCGVVLVPDEQLPVLLPDNVQVGKTTQNPLLSVDEWVHTTCPKCGKPARRETDTMDTFVDSSWYYARYTDVNNEQLPYSREQADKWLPVDQYIGGIEHACMHLLYARFFHKFMRDLGMVKGNEPFARLLTQGMVTKDGAKMSKSKGNVVDPQYIIDRFGSDTARVFMLFTAPPEKDKEWNDDGIVGSFRFLNRVYRIVENNQELIRSYMGKTIEGAELTPLAKELRFSTHHTIKKWLHDIENRMQFNTAIAAVMEHLNKLTAVKNPDELQEIEKCLFAQACAIMPRLLSIFAPHMAEELWEMLSPDQLVLDAGVPSYEEAYLQKEELDYVIQINGKIRGKVTLPAGLPDEAVREMALQVDNIQKAMEGKEIVKVLVIQKKLISIVVK